VAVEKGQPARHPGDSSFVADALGALRVCESAVFVVNAVMGVEVHTQRPGSAPPSSIWPGSCSSTCSIASAPTSFRTLDSLKSAFGQHVVATEIPIGSEHEISGIVDLIDMKAYRYEGASRENCSEIPIPAELQAQAEEYRERLMDEVSETSDALMERYLEGEEISHDEIVAALKDGTNHGSLFPVTCGVSPATSAPTGCSTRSSRTFRPRSSTAAWRSAISRWRPRRTASCSPMSSRPAPTRSPADQPVPCVPGHDDHDSHVLNTRTHHKERSGSWSPSTAASKACRRVRPR